MKWFTRRQLKKAILTRCVEQQSFDYLQQDLYKLSLLRLFYIPKSFKDAFKPYKSFWYLGRDFLEPFIGCFNILKGLGKILGLPAFVFAIVIYYTFSYFFKTTSSFLVDSPSKYKNTMLEVIKTLLGGILEGLSQILQGSIQLIKTPLTLIIQIPCRCILTVVKGWQPVYENKSMKAMIAEYALMLNNEKENPSVMDILKIITRMEEKYQKAVFIRKQQAYLNHKKDELNNVIGNLINSLPYEENEISNDPLWEQFKKHNFLIHGKTRPILFHHELRGKVRTSEKLTGELVQQAKQIHTVLNFKSP